MKLTKENPISETFAFDGAKNILIVGGVGILTLERSVRGSEFYPLSTNLNGGTAVFKLNEGCAYNGTLTEQCNGSEYRFVGQIESGEVEITMSRSG